MSDVCSCTNKRDGVERLQLPSQKGILEEVEKMHSKYSCSRLHLQKEQGHETVKCQNPAQGKGAGKCSLQVWKDH